MGKAYTEAQRAAVRVLLEAHRDEESIEKETGVSDRTIRRWKMELERTGRIGKPMSSRTGRQRVLTAEIEEALFEYARTQPEMSIDDVLWWLYDKFKIVAGTRTIRRAFERRGDKLKPGKSRPFPTSDGDGNSGLTGDHVDHTGVTQTTPTIAAHSSPYSHTPVDSNHAEIENRLRQAMQQEASPHPYPALVNLESELPDDEETIKLQLQQIALQKREVELRLKMRKMREAKQSPSTPRISSTGDADPSPLFNPAAASVPSPPRRDSRSKKKIAESKRRTAERQQRMLRDLERRSRRRDHLTAEWVESKDIWPLRPQGVLADLMHNSGCYAFSHNNESAFEAIYRDLYQLVDNSKGDWEQRHDELLRDRTKRKMGQLRNKMLKTGEIIPRSDGLSGYQRAENYTGEAAGATIGDESEIIHDPALHDAEVLQAQQSAAAVAAVAAAAMPHDENVHYNPNIPDQHHVMQQDHGLSYPAPITHQNTAQYALLDQQHHGNFPYAQIGSQQELQQQENMAI